MNDQSQPLPDKRLEEISQFNLPLRVEGWHASLTESGWYIKDAQNRIVATVHFEKNEEPTNKGFDEGNAVARAFVATVNSLLQQPATSERCVKCGCTVGVDANGWCMSGRPYIANQPDSNQRSICPCKCVFPATGAGEGEQRRFEAKLLNFADDERIELCEPCLREAVAHNLVIFSSSTAPPANVARVDPASSITEKAHKIALKLKRDADGMFAMSIDDEPIVTQWADIIAAEFGADVAPSSTRSSRSTRPSQPRSS
jgi:hypothetical protein